MSLNLTSGQRPEPDHRGPTDESAGRDDAIEGGLEGALARSTRNPDVASWRDVPALPIAAFKQQFLASIAAATGRNPSGIHKILRRTT